MLKTGQLFWSKSARKQWLLGLVKLIFDCLIVCPHHISTFFLISCFYRWFKRAREVDWHTVIETTSVGSVQCSWSVWIANGAPQLDGRCKISFPWCRYLSNRGSFQPFVRTRHCAVRNKNQSLSKRCKNGACCFLFITTLRIVYNMIWYTILSAYDLNATLYFDYSRVNE